MAKKNISTLKSYFLTGLYPTQQQFHDTLDSFVHKDDVILVSQISGLSALLNNKVETSQIEGLIAGLQSETDQRLATTDKSVVGAINELKNLIEDLADSGKTHSYTLDFGTNSESVPDVNVLGELAITRIVAHNVASLYVSYGNVTRQPVSLTGEVAINVPDGSVLTWEIVRITEGEVACVGVKIELY